jgi:hypothetical protein
MKTTDLFKINRSSQRINESMEKMFGKKLNLEAFDLPKLEDARNKLRTQISQVRSESGFNENLENDAYAQAQWMLDAINAEIAEREEFIVDPGTAEAGYEEGFSNEIDIELHRIAKSEDEEMLIDAMGGLMGGAVADALEDMKEELAAELASQGMDDVIDDEDKMVELLMDKIVDEYGEGDFDSDEGGDTDDAEALASAGRGDDEDYGGFPESIQGEDMRKVTEGEIQQASAIVTAKTMVDRVGRWIEELSGMENDTLLQLGDQIRDEMGSEQAKQFISTVAPAIQQALDSLKQSRETLSTGVRTLTGEEQPAEMLGSEAPKDDLDSLGDVEPDAMNAGDEEDMGPPEDEFAAAEPAAGGLETAGREKRESIEFQNKLLKVLVG